MYKCIISTQERSLFGNEKRHNTAQEFDTFLSARRYLDKKVKEFKQLYDDVSVFIKNSNTRIRLRAKLGEDDIGDIRFIFFDGEIREV